MTMQSETSFMLHLTSELYRTPYSCNPPINAVDIPNLLSLAIKNNMGYYVAKKLVSSYSKYLDSRDLSVSKSIVIRGDEKLEQIKRVLEMLNRSLSNYLLIKTFRVYPRIPNDLDILTPDSGYSIKRLKDVGMKVLESTDQDAVLLYGNTKVHLHKLISWAKPGTTFLDSGTIWDRTRTVKTSQTQVQIPNYDAEFLIYVAHIAYEPLHATLSDLLYIYNIAFKVNWTLVLKQADKHSWMRTLRNMIKLLDDLHHSIYPPPCPFMELDLKHQEDNHERFVSLPISLPINYMITGVIEKRLLLWAISKRLLKSIFILVSGDTHGSFHTPPESCWFKER